MAKCNYCGTTILFGGARDNGLRYCNARGQQAGRLLALSNQLPQAQVQENIWKVHQGSCPKCGGSGPVDVRQLPRLVRSVPDPVEQFFSGIVPFVWAQEAVGRRRFLACARLVGLSLGPLIVTPIQIGRNLFSAASPPEPSKPSLNLEKALRIAIARQTMAASQPKA